VVLPEQLCEHLASLADKEMRTVSNMAKVLIQEGLSRHETSKSEESKVTNSKNITESFRSSLEAQKTQRLRGAPKRIRLNRRQK
tara:strand:+ start:110 stop:361 length:252 start_codon:yes stop_codon:yes gene_type:complete